MRIFPGKLDLSILSAGGAADTGTDLAGQPWGKPGNKQSSSSELLLSKLSLSSPCGPWEPFQVYPPSR